MTTEDLRDNQANAAVFYTGYSLYSSTAPQRTVVIMESSSTLNPSAILCCVTNLFFLLLQHND